MQVAYITATTSISCSSHVLQKGNLPNTELRMLVYFVEHLLAGQTATLGLWQTGPNWANPSQGRSIHEDWLPGTG